MSLFCNKTSTKHYTWVWCICTACDCSNHNTAMLELCWLPMEIKFCNFSLCLFWYSKSLYMKCSILYLYKVLIRQQSMKHGWLHFCIFNYNEEKMSYTVGDPLQPFTWISQTLILTSLLLLRSPEQSLAKIGTWVIDKNERVLTFSKARKHIMHKWSLIAWCSS